MKKGGGHAKGSQFERDICKKLSLWWTKQERDDVFWRTPQSGGRATIRKKIGKDTYGHYGDILAVDPIGLPLLKFMTFELKCGYGLASVMDLIDGTDKCLWYQWILSAERVRIEAMSRYWGLVIHRPKKKTVIIYPCSLRLRIAGMEECFPHLVLYHSHLNFSSLEMVLFDDFLKVTDPEKIKCIME